MIGNFVKMNSSVFNIYYDQFILIDKLTTLGKKNEK